jgi:hypothetical protein
MGPADWRTVETVLLHGAKDLRLIRPMRRRVSLLLAAVMGALGLASTPTAQACTPPIPGLVSGRLVTPSIGQTGVPTNAQVTVAYFSTSPVEDHLKLQSSSGVPVPAIVSEAGGGPNRAGFGMTQGFVLTPLASARNSHSPPSIRTFMRLATDTRPRGPARCLLSFARSHLRR